MWTDFQGEGVVVVAFAVVIVMFEGVMALLVVLLGGCSDVGAGGGSGRG